MKKRFLCLILGVLLVFTSAIPAMADQESDLETQKQQNSSALNDTNSEISSTQSAQDSLKQELSALDSQLVTLMSDIDILSGDIQTARDQITEKTTEITTAQAACDQQYADMETRIRYMYENGGSMTWFSYILQAKDISDLLNRVEYTSQLNQYDRNQLAEYEQNIQDLNDKKTALEQNEADLEEEQLNLQDQQASLNTALEQKKAQSASYDEDIASLRQKADALNETIKEQNAQLKQIQAEKEAAAQAAAKAAAESAAAQAAADAQSKAAAESAAAKAAADEAAKNSSSQNSSSQSSSSQNSSSSSSATDTSGSTNIGQQIADFACQFVGNPYVVAGESLTEGADCAGFVKAVYAHFGVYFPRDLAIIGTLGRSVSLSEAKPGDILMYSGHTAIYIGNDHLVNASSPELGIMIRSPVTYRTLVDIRRVFDY